MLNFRFFTEPLQRFYCRLTQLLVIESRGKPMKNILTLIVAIFTAQAITSLPARADEKSIIDSFSDKLVDADGKKVSRDSLKGKVVGIYFSAHWCPPCRLFTPSLVKFRDKNQKEFEVVFVSIDNSPAEKKKYMSHEKMKWPTIKGIRSQEGNDLAQKFQVEGIPALIIIAPDGRTITADGRSHVTNDPDGALKLWKKAAGIAKN